VKLSKLILLTVTALVSAAAAEPRRVVFEGASSEHKWTLKELDSSLPSDWSAFKYLVVEMRASSPQRFQFRLYTPQGHATVGMHPYPGAKVRAALALDWFAKPPREGVDMAAVGNRSRPGYFVSFWGPYRPVNAIDAIGVVMDDPLNKPTLEILSVKLAKESPGDAVLEPLPLVDEFGQWISADYPGKAKSLEDLRRDWAREEKSLGKGEASLCKYGGLASTKAKATGFFRVEQIDGRWWFVDPDGHLFLSVGSDVMQPSMFTPIEGRKAFFRELPPASIDQPRWETEPSASFFSWNLQRRFGADWRAKWVDLTMRRMTDWGFNTVGNWSHESLWEAERKAYTIPLRDWLTKISYMGLPDVYSDEFVQVAETAAKEQCAALKDDPWLLGYFLANEPPWPNRESVVVDLILEGPDTPTQREVKRFLAEGDTPARRRAFVYRAFEKYIEVVNAAVRKYDPNHLNLGMRYGGHPPEEMSRAARAFDVYSINIYEYAPKREDIERAYKLAGKPVLVGEFHIGTPGRGLAAGLRQALDLKERGNAYRYYVEQAFAMPEFIGAHWFQWMDEPVTGRGDGENYNIGFVDITDRPYTDMVEAAKETHSRMYRVHGGKEPPFSQPAAVR
jgi:hypothetical protein